MNLEAIGAINILFATFLLNDWTPKAVFSTV
jgi:hypothetical protein